MSPRVVAAGGWGWSRRRLLKIVGEVYMGIVPWVFMSDLFLL